jgi:hypothetical protein
MLLPVLFIFFSGLAVQAQPPQDPAPNQSRANTPDVTEELRLTPDQIRGIREIQRETREERAAIGMRLRLANRALNEALDAVELDENLVEQRIQEFTTAQAAQFRFRVRTEMRIRRLLNSAQLARWQELRIQTGDLMRSPDGNPRPNRPVGDALRPNRNGLAPRGNQPVRNPRP